MFVHDDIDIAVAYLPLPKNDASKLVGNITKHKKALTQQICFSVCIIFVLLCSCKGILQRLPLIALFW